MNTAIVGLAVLIGNYSIATDCRTSEEYDSIGTQRIEEVTVSGIRVPVHISSTNPTQSLSKNDLEALGVNNLADGVKRFAGVNVRDYGGVGGMKTVSIRNLGAHHTGVSYDGICMSNTQAGQIDIGRYSLDNLASLSLTIGQNNDILQTARHYMNAGTLTLISEKPHFDDGKRYDVRVRMKGGSFGLTNPSLRYWQMIGKHTFLSLNAAYQRSDGNYPYLLQNGKTETEEKRQNSDIYSWNGETNIYHTFRDGSTLDLKSLWYSSDRGLPGNVILYNNNSRQRLWDEELCVQGGYTKHFSKQWALAAKARYSYTWNKYQDPDQVYPDGSDTDINTQREYYASLVAGWKPMETISLSLAEDISLNTLENNIYIDAGNMTQYPNPKRLSSLTALTAQVHWEKIKVEGNLLATFVKETTEIERVTPEDRKRLSPTLSVSYKPLSEEPLYIRAMMKSTFRVPTFNDLYYRRMGTYTLKPEKANEWNIGVSWYGCPISATKYVSATIDAYYNNVTDKIVAFPSTYVWRMMNFGKAEIKGIDVTLSAEIKCTDRISAIVTGALTIQEALDKTEDSPTYGSQLPYTPKESGNVSVVINNPYVNLAYSILFQGKRYSLAQNTNEYLISGYDEHSVSLSKEIQLKDMTLNIQATVSNIFNKQYEIIKYYPMPRRNFALTATLNL